MSFLLSLHSRTPRIRLPSKSLQVQTMKFHGVIYSHIHLVELYQEISIIGTRTMVKLLSLIAITGGMAATSSSAEGGGIRLQSIVTSNQPRMDDTTITTEDLELATRQFVESNIGKIRIVSNRDIDGKKSRRLNSEPSTRHERTSEHVTLDVNVGNNWSSGKSGKESTSTTVAGITSEEVREHNKRFARVTSSTRTRLLTCTLYYLTTHYFLHVTRLRTSYRSSTSSH